LFVFDDNPWFDGIKKATDIALVITIISRLTRSEISFLQK